MDHLRSGVQDQPDQHDEMVSIKNIKFSQVWWHIPLIPATLKAEAGDLFELGRQRLQ